MLKVAVIIPAYNEATRIVGVLQAVKGASIPSEIIVVDDGSADETTAAASTVPGVKVLTLPKNVGKGGAMAAGVAATKAEIVMFVDADLQGLESHHVDQIAAPMVRNECDMCVGVFRGGKKIGSNAAMVVTPFLSGQRAMKRELFESIPHIAEVRFGVEIEITEAVRKKRAKVKRVSLKGVSNCFKEEKMGVIKGFQARTKMYREIREAMLRSRKKKRPNHRRWLD